MKDPQMAPSIIHRPPAQMPQNGVGERARSAWIFPLLAAMVLGAMVPVGCRSTGRLPSVPVEPPSPAGPTPSCSGEACLQRATALDRQRDYLGARDALKTGCETGSIDACARLGRGAYLLKEDDRVAFTKKGCMLGDFASCVLTCEGKEDRSSYFDYFEEQRRACPDPRANLHACQKLEVAKAEYEIAAFCADLDPGSPFSSPEQRCPDTGSLERCEIRWMLRERGSGDTEQEAVTLCQRGSAWACSELLSRRCEHRSCTPEQLAAQRGDKEGAQLVAKVEQLCKDGSVDACLVLPGRGSPRELIALCWRGSKTACERLSDPKDEALVNEPLCLHGDETACRELLKEVGEDAGKLSAVLARMCAADFSVCLQHQWYPAMDETERAAARAKKWEPPIVSLREAPCSEVVLHARALAGILKPTTDPEAERFCQSKLSHAARSCMLTATDLRAMSSCERAQTSGEAIRQQAEQLAAAASSYFEEHGHIPTAPPSPPRPPCCGARCPALPTGRTSTSAYPQLRTYWRIHDLLWVQLDLKSTDRELIASASGDWDCDGTAEAYEARWSLINGKVSRITVTETAGPKVAP
jgi:hypothetical protein